MLRAGAQPAGDRNGFAQFDVAAKIVLAGLLHFTLCQEEWLFKVFDFDTDVGLFERSRVLRVDGSLQFGQTQPAGSKITDGAQSDETVWLNSDGLIEFRYIHEVQIERISASQLVSRILCGPSNQTCEQDGGNGRHAD